MTDTFAQSSVPFLDMAANQQALGEKIAANMKPAFADFGLSLESFVVENISLPDELQKLLDQRIGMTMLGDMNKYTQYQVAQSLPIAAGNEGGGAAGIGVGLGAGLTMAQSMMNAMKPGEQAPPAAPAGAGPAAPVGGAPAAPATETKFCMNCGKPIPRSSKFCPECGGAQQ
jgi:membrane protease subunit (stomatin/prohibitin family)